MDIHTTLNIKQDIFDKITHASRISRNTKTVIIKNLFALASKEHSKLVTSNSGIRYQVRDKSNSFHTFHITYRIDEYEYYQDMRKLFRAS